MEEQFIAVQVMCDCLRWCMLAALAVGTAWILHTWWSLPMIALDGNSEAFTLIINQDDDKTVPAKKTKTYPSMHCGWPPLTCHTQTLADL